MLYKKPNGMKYTEMAIFIDNNIRNFDDKSAQEKCFEYMWHLFYILAVKGRFFTSNRDYDEYAIYGATQLYLRYKKEGTEKGKNLKPIKSCLNYIKKVLYPMKVNYQKTFFEQVIRSEDSPDGTVTQLKDDLTQEARNANNMFLHIDYEECLSKVCGTIKYVLSTSPYQKDLALMHNLYLSCLLTLLKMLTVSNRNKERIHKKVNRALPVDNLLDQIYYEEMSDDVVLYHVDSTLANYVLTLVARIKKEIVKDLRDIIGQHEPSDQVVRDIMMSSIERYVYE